MVPKPQARPVRSGRRSVLVVLLLLVLSLPRAGTIRLPVPAVPAGGGALVEPGRTCSMNPILLLLLTTAGAFLLHVLMVFVLVGRKK